MTTRWGDASIKLRLGTTVLLVILRGPPFNATTPPDERTGPWESSRRNGGTLNGSGRLDTVGCPDIRNIE
jgi:hypothetical protein